MGYQKRNVQPCLALLRDGSRCGKYAKPGQTLCSVHQPDYVPKGAAVPRPRPISHEERLRQFSESNDPRVAMAAIAALEKRGVSPGVPRDDSADVFVAACTDEQRERLAALLGAVSALKAEVYADNPDLQPRKNHDPIVKRDQPPRPDSAIPVTPVEPARVDEAETSGDEREPDEVRPLVTPAMFAQVGLTLTPAGGVTHALGDEYAQKVIDGTLAWADARQQHEARLRQLKDISR